MKTLYFIPLLFLSLLTACDSKPAEEKEAARPVFYEIAAAPERRAVKTFSGVSRSGAKAELSFKVGGVVRRLAVRTGDRIRKGRAIASLDDAEFQLRHSRAVAALKSAGARFRAAESSYKKIELLYEKSGASLDEFERAKAERESSEATLKSAESLVESARDRLRDLKIVAPFDGVVSGVSAEENEVVGPGVPVVVLASERDPEVETAVPESAIHKIKNAREIKIVFSALPGKKFAGKVSEASFDAKRSGVRPVAVKILAPSPDIRPGMPASVAFYFGNDGKKAGGPVMVSADAMGADGEGNFVFVIFKETDGRRMVIKRRVKAGKLTKNGFEIKEGLKAGELVVAAGLSQMYDGREVTLSEQ